MRFKTHIYYDSKKNNRSYNKQNKLMRIQYIYSPLIKLIKSIVKFTAATNARMRNGKYFMSTNFVECEIRSFLNRSACHEIMHLASAIYIKSNTMLPNSNHSFSVASLVFLSSLFNSFLLFLFFTTMATIAIPTPHIAAMIGLMYL